MRIFSLLAVVGLCFLTPLRPVPAQELQPGTGRPATEKPQITITDQLQKRISGAYYGLTEDSILLHVSTHLGLRRIWVDDIAHVKVKGKSQGGLGVLFGFLAGVAVAAVLDIQRSERATDENYADPTFPLKAAIAATIGGVVGFALGSTVHTKSEKMDLAPLPHQDRVDLFEILGETGHLPEWNGEAVPAGSGSSQK